MIIVYVLTEDLNNPLCKLEQAVLINEQILFSLIQVYLLFF